MEITQHHFSFVRVYCTSYDALHWSKIRRLLVKHKNPYGVFIFLNFILLSICTFITKALSFVVFYSETCLWVAMLASFRLNERCRTPKLVSLLTFVPQVWPWAILRDQYHVSPQLWRIKREREWMRATEARWQSICNVSPLNSVDSCTKGIWLTRVCVCVIFDTFEYSWMGDVLGEAEEGGNSWVWWLILHPGCFDLAAWSEMRPWCLHVSGISCAKSEPQKTDPV